MIGLSLIPLAYRIGLVAALALSMYVIGHHQGANGVQRDWEASKTAIVVAKAAAVDNRLADNAKTAAEQAGFNLAIKKAKNEDLAPVVAAIAADGLRIGKALCPSRFTATAQAASASGSDGPDHVAAGVRDAAERDFKALELEVANSLASGRSAQKFIHDNGLAP